MRCTMSRYCRDGAEVVLGTRFDRLCNINDIVKIQGELITAIFLSRQIAWSNPGQLELWGRVFYGF